MTAKPKQTVRPVVVRGLLALFQFGALLYLAGMVLPAVFAELVFLPIAARLGALLAVRSGITIASAASAAIPVSVVGSGAARIARPGADPWAEFDRTRGPSIVAGVVVAVIFSLTFNKDIAASAAALLWWPAVVLLVAFSQLVVGHLTATGRTTRGILLQSGPVSLAFAALAIAAARGRTLGVDDVAIAYVSGQLVAVLAAALAARTAEAPEPGRHQGSPAPSWEFRPDRLTLSSALTLGLPLLVISVVSILGSPTEAGRLAAAIRLLSPITIVATAAAAAFVPRIVTQRSRQRPDRPFDLPAVRWSVAAVALLTVPYSVLLLAQPQILELALGEQYQGLEAVVRLVAFGQLFQALAGVAVELGQATGHATTDARAVVASLLVAAIVWPFLATIESAAFAGAFLFACLVANRSAQMFIVSYLRSSPAVAVSP